MKRLALALIAGTAFSQAALADHPLVTPLSAVGDDFDTMIEVLGEIDLTRAAVSQTDVLTVDVRLEPATCGPATGPCIAAAPAGNNGPIRLTAAVTRGNAPVTGLAPTNFDLRWAAADTARHICGTTVCTVSNFEEVAPGLYRMDLATVDHDVPSPGIYTGTLAATDPVGASGLALLAYTVPNAKI